MRLVGCGILRRELESLIAKHHLQVSTDFLDPMLHVEMNRLGKELPGRLGACEGEPTVVFYGYCHPRMDQMVEEAHAVRMEGLNCFEMLMGSEWYERELSGGAYFLFEHVARAWDEIAQHSFSGNVEVMREIFKDSHRYVLAIHTPLSGDFSKEAEHVAATVGLPLRFAEADLEHLESLLLSALKKAA